MSEENLPNSKTDSAANGDCRPAPCSPDRVTEADRKMIFRVCQKLNAVLGLNEQELEWLASLGAEVSEANVSGQTPTTESGSNNHNQLSK